MNNITCPPNLQWEVTTECNHDCIHCYNYWRKDDEKIAGMSKVKTESEYLEIARTIIKQKPVSIVITGGEPLLVFDRIKSSINLFKEAGIVVSINTNAALLNNEIISYLKEKDIKLFVSFPCANAEICDFITSRVGSLDRIVEKLDLAKKSGVNFVNNIVVSKINLAYVEETALFLKQRYGAKRVSITRVGKPINSTDEFNRFLLDKAELKILQDICVRLSKEGINIDTSCPYTPCSLYTKEAFELFAYTKLCTAGKTTYAVDTDGNVKACPRDSRLYGNILTESFDQIWQKMSDWRDGTFIPEECKKCKDLARCLGGCRVDSIPFTGKTNSLDLVSDIDNVPIKYAKENELAVVKNSDVDEFAVSKSISVLKDGESYRMTHGRKYVYVTEKLYAFLKNHETFSFKEFTEFFETKDYEVINKVINKLALYDIIHKK